MAGPKMTKNQMRRAKKKEDKKKAKEDAIKPKEEPTTEIKTKTTHDVEQPQDTKDTAAELAVKKSDPDAAAPDDPIPVLASYDDDEENPMLDMYRDIFTKFGARAANQVEEEANAGHKGEVFFDEDDIPSEEDDPEHTGLSKKKRKALNKLSIAELKALVRKPEVVEWHDVSSSDPRLLVQIKATRNVVPVPAHWSLKREYLSSKRGVEKPPFKLPEFISETGITEMRDAVLEKQEAQTLKQKQRERINPKMGKLDIDYQKLYDAFFRFQTKPDLTRYGEVYYEGKEWETDFRHYRPGELSDSLKEALSIPPGAPPPWLINQQRFGPPPSYPNLKIAGLNAPPPTGGQWGFHPGGYGKPPVDEFNRPLFGGDIFGITAGTDKDPSLRPQGEPIVRTLWGELQPREDDDDEESGEDDDDSDEDSKMDGEEGEEVSAAGLMTPAGAATGLGLEGVETSVAGEFDLRKNRPSGVDTEASTHPRSAYTVIPERAARAEGFFGSDRLYDVKGSVAGGKVLGQDDDSSRKRKKPGDVDVALDPDQLAENDGMSRDELRRQFEEGRKDEGVGAQWSRPYDDDLTEMIATESRKRQKRDEEKRGERKAKAGRG